MEKMVNAMKIVGFPVDNSVLKKITDRWKNQWP
jgi:hypothetical protein